MVLKLLRVMAQTIEFRFTSPILVDNYTRENTQLVTNLQQTCSKRVGTSLLPDLFALPVPSLLTSCYKPAADLLQA